MSAPLSRRAFLSLAAYGTAFSALTPASAAEDKNRPNVLLIVSDDQGWGDLPSNWKKTDAKLPFLDRIGREGYRFPEYHTAPLCGPARAGLLTGQYSMDCGMWRGPGSSALGEANYRGIKRDVRMLPEILKTAGYRSGLFGKWHLGEIEGERPNDRGFDEFYGFLKGAHSYELEPGKSKFFHNRKPYVEKAHATDYITDKSLAFMKECVKNKQPFFSYVAYNAVHGPLYSKERQRPSGKPEWLEKAKARGIDFPRRDYVAILEHMDDSIGRLLAFLEKSDIERDTIVIFASDNGAMLLEGHKGYPGNNGPFRGAKAQTYQGGIQVPCVMKWPAQIPAGGTSEDHVLYVDIFCTVLDACGCAVPKMNGKNPVRGVSLLSHMKSKGKKKVPLRSMFFELFGMVGMRKGNWKLVGKVEETRGTYTETAKQLETADLELYDLSTDISESNDLRTAMPELYGKLKKEMSAYFASIDLVYPGAPAAKPLTKAERAARQKARAERQRRRAAAQ